MPYTLALAEEIASKGVSVTIVYWDRKKLTPFSPQSSKLTLIPRSSLTVLSLILLLRRIRPEITMVSGWMDWGYLVALFVNARSLKIRVALLDDQWKGTARQKAAKLLSPLRLLRLFFTHAAVAGLRQKTFARHVGFKDKEILVGWLSADSRVFRDRSRLLGCQEPNKAFIFVGRLSREKGVDVLARAWEKFSIENQGWSLFVVGNGPLESEFEGLANCILLDFQTPTDLATLMQSSAIGIVPSHRDQWGVVVHEMTLCGLPVIASNEVGSAEMFVHHMVNGAIFRAGSAEELLRMMRLFSSLPKATWESFSYNSVRMASVLNNEQVWPRLVALTE